jgi:hypothetical protein
MTSSAIRKPFIQAQTCRGRRGAALLTVMMAAHTVCGAVTLSPLATVDQLTLDRRATRLDNTYAFPAARVEAKATFRLAHGLPVSAEAEARLDQDIDELVFSAIQKAVNGDPLYPKVYWLNTPAKHWFDQDVQGGRYSYDNPDNIYRTIPIEGDSRYVVHGRRFGAGPTDVTFSLISNVNSQNTIAILASQDLIVGADGRFDITIDNQPANGRVNHIQSTSSAKQLFIRNNLGNWNTEIPDALTVERLGSAPSRATRGDVAVGLEAWANFQESILDYGVGALGLKTHINPVNTLPAPSSSSTLGTLVTQASSFGHFKLGDDEALVATLKPGGAGYFVFPVTDPWLVSIDPIGHQTSLNNKQAHPNPDGSYTFVVSVKDPGVHNWLDTVGLHEGTIMVRWQSLPSVAVEGGPQVSATVVKLTDLAQALPAGTSYVTAAQRAQALADRGAGYKRRIGYVD